MPVPAIAIHGSGPRRKIARSIDSTFEGVSPYDRVVTLEFDYDRVVPPPRRKGVRNLYRFLERTAANMSAAALVGMEFSAHSVDEILAGVQTRLYRLLQWIVPAFVAMLLAIPVADLVVVAPAAWYGLPTATFAPIGWLAMGAGWLKMGIAGGVTVLISLGGLRLLLTMSPRPALITFRSVAFLFLQPVLIVIVGAFAADLWLVGAAVGTLALFSFLTGGVAALMWIVATFALLIVLRSRWSKTSLRGPIKALLDAFRYLGEPEFRAEVQQALDKAISRARDRVLNNEEFVLVAQGWGTVIALDSIVHSRAFGKKDRVLLVTMGSPLRRWVLSLYPRTLFPEWEGVLVDLVAGRLGEFRWMNVYRPMDYVGGALDLSAFSGRDICTHQRRRMPSHTDYWLDVEARRAIRHGLNRLPPVQPLRIKMKDAAHRMPHPTRTDFELRVPTRARATIGATLSVAVFGGMLWWVATGAGVLTLRIDRTPEMLDERGVVVDAAVTHRRQAVERDRGVTFVHQWEFEFTDPAGAPRVLEVERDASDAFLDVPHRFDDRALTRHIRAGCAPAALPLWWSAGDLESPCTVQGVRLRYYPGEVEIFDLPDFPRRRFGSAPAHGWTEAGIVAGALSILILIPLVLGAKVYFLFVGLPTARRPEDAVRSTGPRALDPTKLPVAPGNVPQRGPARAAAGKVG